MISSAAPILFHDEFLLALDKPSGMLVHRGWGRDDVVLVDVAREILGQEKVHPLHRIDRGTSGVVLFGLDAKVASELHERFENGEVSKRYLALVRGVCPEQGEVDHAIPRREDGPRVDAVTTFARLGTAETEPRHVSLVEAFPKTGRLHQVRRHLKHINHPVIGDANYGKGAINREMAKRYGLERLALHAESLRFQHPVTGDDLTIRSSVPADFREPLTKMGINYLERG